MHSSASEAKDSWMFWSKVPGQAPLPQLKVAQQREVSHTFFKLAQQYSALQEEECLHVQPINTPLEYCRHVTHDVFWLKVKRRSETSKLHFQTSNQDIKLGHFEESRHICHHYTFTSSSSLTSSHLTSFFRTSLLALGAWSSATAQAC